MNKYSVDKIRNVCLMGHGGVGKTSFAEAALFNSKATDRLGKITDGTTVCDYDPEEKKRNISINTTMAPVEWNGVKINFIDTPGYFDFVGEAIEGIRVADAALILISGRSGVAVGAEHAWEYAKERKVPVAFFVNKMDDEHADFNAVLDSLKKVFGTSVAPFQYPINEGGKLTGYVDIVKQKGYKFDGAKAVEGDIPDSLADEVTSVRDQLIEAIAETDEALMEKFFSGVEFTDAEISSAVKKGVRDGAIVPVYVGSAAMNLGINPILDAISDYFPTPLDAGEIKATNKGNEISLKADPQGPLAALVFKTIADPFVGKLSLFRVYSGTLKSDSTVYNSTKDTNEKVGKICHLRGNKQIDAGEVLAGDIGAVTKLSATVTGDTLCATGSNISLEGINFPLPNLTMAIESSAKGDEDKIASGLRKLEEADPTFVITNNTETRQMVISGIGEQHIDVIVSRLKSTFGVSVNLIEAKVPYRETIRKKVKVQGRHKKQSGGHGQFGDVWIEFEPGTQEDLEFAEKVFGGAVPKNYFPAVEKGLRDSIHHGVLAGYPVVNLKATLVDGSYHPVDSSEMAFKIAASQAYKEGLKQANPALLEPYGKLEVTVPESYMGDIVGDVNKRRGRILGMNPIGGGLALVEAEVPLSEMNKYATDLRSMTQARGKFKLEFIRYEEAPSNVAAAIIEKAKAEAAE